MGDVSFTQQTLYKNNLEMELQVQTCPLLGAITVQSDKSASKIKIKDIVGNGMPQEDDERNGDTKWQRTPFEGVWIPKPNELYWAEIIENADELATAIDLQGAATKNGAGVVQRSKTRRILEGFYGNRISGKDGTTVNAFPAANYVAVDTGAAAASKMNTAKIRAATKQLDKAYVDDMLPRYMILTTEDNDALLTEVPATSSDFKSAYSGTYSNGKITSLLGWNFIHMELDNALLGPVSGLATDVNGYRLNPFWVKPGLVANFWQELRAKVGEIPEKRWMPGVLAGTTLGATRTQEGMTGIIRNLKG